MKKPNYADTNYCACLYGYLSTCLVTNVIVCFCSLLLVVAATAANFDAQINIAPLLNEINFKSSKALAEIENPNEAKIEKWEQYLK